MHEYTSVEPKPTAPPRSLEISHSERWGAGVETQKNVRGEIGG